MKFVSMGIHCLTDTPYEHVIAVIGRVNLIAPAGTEIPALTAPQ